jgi:hypothetical protein
MEKPYSDRAGESRPAHDACQPITILNTRLDPLPRYPGAGAMWCAGARTVPTAEPYWQMGALLFEPDEIDPEFESPTLAATVWVAFGRGDEEIEGTGVEIRVQLQGDTLEEAEAAVRAELRRLADRFLTLAAVRT